MTRVLVWVLVVPFVAWTVLRVTGADLGWLWIALVAYTPYVAATSLVPLLVAAGTRRWVAAGVALVTTGALGLAVLPRWVADGNPAAGGRSLRVLAVNLLAGSADQAELMRLVTTLRPDVLALQELTPESLRRLDRAGLRELMPHVVDRAQVGVVGSGIYSRHPLTEQPMIALGRFRQARAIVRPPGGPEIEVASVHPCAPSVSAKAPCWRAGLDALPRAGGPLRVLAGDFNATLDHWTMRDLLDSGYRDAADVAGKGLTPTWPQDGRHASPWVTIDHVLADQRIAVRSFSVHDLADTDHRPVFAELTLP